ncbi:MAG: hypothetical protein JNK02_14885 [Planctomycetes bacterium]|nr:hypothetical protein [Planctomycetota bacterium]
MRHGCVPLALSCVALLVGCEAQRAGLQPEPAREGPAVVAQRFEIELWELPLARAEQLFHGADPISSTVALLVDERGLRKPLRELAARDPAVRRFERAAFEAAAGARGILPPRVGGSAERSWSDGLRLELGVPADAGWAEQRLEFEAVWTSPQGERLASASGSIRWSPGRDVALWCLPSRILADLPEPRTARAVVAHVRIVPRL